VRDVEVILRSWDPIGVEPGSIAPADEYDDYAPHIVSLVLQGCSLEELCEHLEALRVDTIGVKRDPDKDRIIGQKILDTIRRERLVKSSL